MKLFEVVFDHKKYRKYVKVCGIPIFQKKNRMQELYETLSGVKEQLKLVTDIVYTCHKINQIPPAGGTKRIIQKHALSLLDLVDKICVENGLMYWLDFGSLIGAIRHSGFIPWDDDIDVCMLRCDYEKILTILPKKWEADGISFVVRERLDDHFQVRLCSCDNSIGLDIFPVDEFSISPREGAKADIERRIKQAYPKIQQLSKQKGEFSDLSALRGCIQKIQVEDVLGNDIDKNGDEMLMYGIDYPHTHPECILVRNTIFPLRKKIFEGRLCWIPNKPEEHLSSLYGDWMSYPRFI